MTAPPVTEKRYEVWTSRTIVTRIRVAERLPDPLRSPVDLAAYVRTIFERLDHGVESFVLLCLNSKNRITCWKVISQGTLTQSLVHPREVFAVAIRAKACSIVLAHNHPSGDHEPSPEDIGITQRLVACGELLGIRVAEHLVVNSEGSYSSFVDRGWI